jgi:hypothetical protein
VHLRRVLFCFVFDFPFCFFSHNLIFLTLLGNWRWGDWSSECLPTSKEMVSRLMTKRMQNHRSELLDSLFAALSWSGLAQDCKHMLAILLFIQNVRWEWLNYLLYFSCGPLFKCPDDIHWRWNRLWITAVLWKMQAVVTPVVIYKLRAVSIVCTISWFFFRWKKLYVEHLIAQKPLDEVCLLTLNAYSCNES